MILLGVKTPGQPKHNRVFGDPKFGPNSAAGLWIGPESVYIKTVGDYHHSIVPISKLSMNCSS
ncbi:hypothetical protein DESUT3_28650 [Desulfuromonas versatilis]|uniref:Uncharacterized protein n=1 Tax=Desulfuromonas versatilis TaxID=2802975 RepID=A0ABM8HRY0_9BACT|nr:hypothetical protein DESUT3_28650 [Desulfuromonas versatilis]